MKDTCSEVDTSTITEGCEYGVTQAPLSISASATIIPEAEHEPKPASKRPPSLIGTKGGVVEPFDAGKMVTLTTDNIEVAAVSNMSSQHDGVYDSSVVAVRYYLLDQLTTIYGFDCKIANDAIEHAFSTIAATMETTDDTSNSCIPDNTTGTKANDTELEGSITIRTSTSHHDHLMLLPRCIDYILENNLAPDSGGPVIPIDTCPHVVDNADSIRDFVQSLVGYPTRSGQTETVNYYYPRLARCSHDMRLRSIGIHGGAATGIDRGVQYKSIYDDSSLNDNSNGVDGLLCPSTENWLCLSCGVVRCSRYVNGHSRDHYYEQQEQQKHMQCDPTNSNHGGGGGGGESHLSRCCVALSLTDLSVWCHACNSYIIHRTVLDPVVQQIEQMKFQSSKVSDI